MNINAIYSKNVERLIQFRSLFKTRDFIFHDGRDLRRFSLGARSQMIMAAIAAITVCFSAYGVASAAAGAIAATGIVGDMSPEAQLARMQSRVDKMRADMDAVRKATSAHARQVEQRQALIAAVLSGRGDPASLDAVATSKDAVTKNPAAASAVEPLRKLESRQISLAIQARRATDQRYIATLNHVRRLGLSPKRLMPAMGGPYEPVTAAGEAAQANADAQFRSLFEAWKRLDTLEQAVISIPSLKPVDHLDFSSKFGVRTDPFRGTAAMHPGVDIPGPLGTPVYATADGMVERAGRVGGYGNMVELNHGRGIETRYGHLSKILVQPNTRVHRGQLIGLMGSTGRSTGSHLHYEVRIDGQAVNPMPYLETASYLQDAQDRATETRDANAAVGGPAD